MKIVHKLLSLNYTNVRAHDYIGPLIYSPPSMAEVKDKKRLVQHHLSSVEPCWVLLISTLFFHKLSKALTYIKSGREAGCYCVLKANSDFKAFLLRVFHCFYSFLKTCDDADNYMYMKLLKKYEKERLL